MDAIATAPVAPVATVTEYTVACECGLTIYPMLGQVAVTCSDCSAQYAMPTRFEYGQVFQVTGTRIEDATAPVATVNEYAAKCECGLVNYHMLGQVAVTCSGCSARYMIPARFEYGQVVQVTGTRQ